MVCVCARARMNGVFELICLFCAADNNSSQRCAVFSGVCVCACVCLWGRECVPFQGLCVLFACVSDSVHMHEGTCCACVEKGSLIFIWLLCCL